MENLRVPIKSYSCNAEHSVSLRPQAPLPKAPICATSHTIALGGQSGTPHLVVICACLQQHKDAGVEPHAHGWGHSEADTVSSVYCRHICSFLSLDWESTSNESVCWVTYHPLVSGTSPPDPCARAHAAPSTASAAPPHTLLQVAPRGPRRVDVLRARRSASAPWVASLRVATAAPVSGRV